MQQAWRVPAGRVTPFELSTCAPSRESEAESCFGPFKWPRCHVLPNLVALLFSLFCHLLHTLCFELLLTLLFSNLGFNIFGSHSLHFVALLVTALDSQRSRLGTCGLATTGLLGRRSDIAAAISGFLLAVFRKPFSLVNVVRSHRHLWYPCLPAPRGELCMGRSY